RLLCGAPAALAGDDLETGVLDRANYDRLKHAPLADGVGEAGERHIVELLPRLARIRMDLVEGQGLDLAGRDVGPARACHVARFPPGDGIVDRECSSRLSAHRALTSTSSSVSDA